MSRAAAPASRTCSPSSTCAAGTTSRSGSAPTTSTGSSADPDGRAMERRKRIGLVAHDAKKAELLDWVAQHRDRLAVHDLCATGRSEEHTSELQSLMRISYAVFCLKKKTIGREIATKNTAATK